MTNTGGQRCCVCNTEEVRANCWYPGCGKYTCRTCVFEHKRSHNVECWYCGEECGWGLLVCKEKECDVPLHESCRHFHLHRDHLIPKLEAIETRITAKLDMILDFLGFEPTQEKVKQLKEHFESLA